MNFLELIDDPIRAARYLGWIKDKSGRKVPFFPNVIQDRYVKLKRNKIKSGLKPRFLVLKSRRVGITTEEQWENILITIFKKNQSVITIAHESDSTELIFKIAKFFYENLHPKLRIAQTKLNKREIVNPSLNSQFYIGTAGSTGFGRGQTIQKAHCSEVAFWPGNLNDIDNLIIGITEAASHGEVVLETTANGRDNWFYHTWFGAEKGENSWIPIFFPWFEDPSYSSNNIALIKIVQETLDDEEKNLIEQYNCNFAQLSWRREKIQELRSKDKFDQEYPKNPTVAFLASCRCFFDTTMIKTLYDNCKSPLSRRQCEDNKLLVLNDDITYWYIPDPNETYIAASDTAGGAITEKANWCVTTIYNKRTLAQVARLRTKMDPVEFARFNCKYFLPQFKNLNGFPKWGIEENNHGHSVINTAYNEMSYPNLYRMEDPIKNQYKGIGWQTTSKTRPRLLDTLKDFLWDCYKDTQKGMVGIINDKVFLEECLNFIDNEGKYEAAEGFFDDTIFPWAIGLQVINQPEVSIDFV